jgi:hypothetical protein
MDQYVGSDVWQTHVRDARSNWRVTVDARSGIAGEVRYVEAEADTGSRYAVTVTRLPHAARRREGGPVLVTVTAPWQDAWALQQSGDLHASYVAEHLSGDRWRNGSLNGGDLAALTLTVAYALGRNAQVDP